MDVMEICTQWQYRRFLFLFLFGMFRGESPGAYQTAQNQFFGVNAMSKKELCENHKTVAYFSGLNGLEIKWIEYGVDYYIYAVSGAWYGGGKPRGYHRVKIQYTRNGNAYFRIHGYRIPLSDCIKM